MMRHRLRKQRLAFYRYRSLTGLLLRHTYFKFIHNILPFFSPKSMLTFSQYFEDLHIELIFKELHITPSYLDIGANHPFELSNTYRLYLNGFDGVLVEPNPWLANQLRIARARDDVRTVAIGKSSGSMPLYVFDSHVLSTLDPAEVAKYQKQGYRVVDQITTQVVGINELVRSLPRIPNLLCIDAEGLDLSIIKTIDYDYFLPIVICVETDSHHSPRTYNQIRDHLNQQGYYEHTRTKYNSIFALISSPS